MKFLYKNFFVIFFLIFTSCSNISDNNQDIMVIKKISYTHLPGWDNGNQIGFFSVLKKACNRIYSFPYNKNIGTDKIIIYPFDYYKMCYDLSKSNIKLSFDMRYFMERHFVPYLVYSSRTEQGNYILNSDVKFTGYFHPVIDGSFKKNDIYQYPVFSKPNDLIIKQYGNIKIIGRINNKGDFISYYTRSQIETNNYKKHHSVLLWLKDPVDSFILQIQGYGIINLPNGKKVHITYAADNGWPYYPISHWFVDYGNYSRDVICWKFIRHWVYNNMDRYQYVFNTNPRYIFFKIIKRKRTIGNFGTYLTPMRSLSIDARYIPIGIPIWIHTKWFMNIPFNRLMLSNNVGDGIISPVRGDIYWGEDNIAFSFSQNMNYIGKMYILLLKSVSDRLN